MKKDSVVSPVLRGDLRLNSRARTRVVARKAFLGDEPDIVFGVQFVQGGSESEVIWLEGRIHADHILTSLHRVREAFICCLDLYRQQLRESTEGLGEDASGVDELIECKLERMAATQVSQDCVLYFTPFFPGIDESFEVEISIEYHDHRLSTRVMSGSLLPFVN